MGIIIILICIAVALFFLSRYMKKQDRWSIYELPFAFSIGIAFVVVLIILGAVNDCVMKDAYTETILQEHDALVTQLSGNLYNKLTYDGRERLIGDIVYYNKKVTLGRARHRNFFVNTFYQEDYDSLPLIDMKKELADGQG